MCNGGSRSPSENFPKWGLARHSLVKEGSCVLADPMSYVLGIDGGTESLRACLFDLEGNLVRHEARAYTTTHPRTAWAEQNPSDWLSCLGEAVRAVCQNVDPEAIKALSIDTTCCTVVALDGNAQPLRPAILWMDMRAAQQARAVSNVDDSALRVNGAGTGQVSAEWMIPKALWLKENEPHVYGAAKTICEYQDYMNFYLTGRMCASINNVSIRWWVLTSTDVRSLFARPDSLTRATRFARSPGTTTPSGVGRSTSSQSWELPTFWTSGPPTS